MVENHLLLLAAPTDCSQLGWLPPFLKGGGAAIGAVIAGIFAVLTWLLTQIVSGAIWWFRNFMDKMDLLRALRSEIRSNTESEAYYASLAAEAKLTDDIAAHKIAGLKYKSFAPTYSENVIFDNLKGQIVRLPGAAIDPITSYYNISKGLTVLLAALGGDEFAELSYSRQIRTAKYVRDIGESTAEKARHALSRLSLVYFLMWAWLAALAIAVVETTRLVAHNLPLSAVVEQVKCLGPLIRMAGLAS